MLTQIGGHINLLFNFIKMNLLNHKIFRVILFVCLLNINEILTLVPVGIVKILFDLFIAFIFVYVFSKASLKRELKGDSFFIKQTFVTKSVFLVIFLILVNVNEIINYNKKPDITLNIIYSLLGITLVFYLAPSWKKYDIDKLKNE